MQRQRRWRAIGASLVLGTAAAAVATGAAGTPAGAQSTPIVPNFGVVDVPAGDVMAPSGYYRTNSAGVTLTGTAAGVTVTLTEGANTFTLDLAPPTGGSLAVGTYTGTALAPTASAPMLKVAKGAAICNAPSGQFTVSDIGFTGPNVTRMAATWRLTCTSVANNPVSSGMFYFGQTAGPIGTPQVGEFYPMTPKRLLDTRDSAPLGPGGSTNLQVAGGSSGVPANAIAVVLNVTGVVPSQATFLTVYPTGSAKPTVSNLNPAAGDIVPNLTTVKVGTSGNVTLYNEAGTTNAVVDVMGYYLPDDNGAQGLRFNPISPQRLLDSRNGTAFGPGESRELVVDASADAAVLNVTGIALNTATYITVSPFGEAVPVVSNLNVSPLQTIPNLVVVKLTGGKANLYNAAGNTHMVVDLVGTFKTTGPTANGGRFVPITPARAYDSRTPILPGQPVGALGAGGSRDLGLLGVLNAYPFEFGGWVGNVTVADTTAESFLTVHPTGFGRPGSSNLNWKAGEIRPNLVMMGTDSYGFNTFYNEAGSTAVIVDIAGWFTR
ncbi:MAG: hypothetical protein AB7O92_25265 [Acidimicrobiia bacterium]